MMHRSVVRSWHVSQKFGLSAFQTDFFFKIRKRIELLGFMVGRRLNNRFSETFIYFHNQSACAQHKFVKDLLKIQKGTVTRGVLSRNLPNL